MPKLIFLCRRRPDITREEYGRRVLEGHVPLALKHHPTLRRYVVNLAEGTPPEGDEIDSLPSLHFDTLEDFKERLYDSPESEEIIARVAEGEYDLTLADSHIVAIEMTWRDDVKPILELKVVARALLAGPRAR